MTEITQADRDAICNVSDRLRSRSYAIVGANSLAEAFARHREQAAAEERAKIVAWLRGFATNKTDELADILEADGAFTRSGDT